MRNFFVTSAQSLAFAAVLSLTATPDLYAMKRGTSAEEGDQATSTASARQPKVARVHDPLLDTTFKKVFMKPECMIDMLNSIYGFEGDDRITEIEGLSQEFASDHPAGRYLVFDIRCSTQGGDSFIVEMQKSLIQGMTNRLELYSAIALKAQWDKYSASFGKDKPHYWKYRDLSKVRTLAFFNYPDSVFRGHSDQGRYVNDYQIQHTVTHANDLSLQQWRFIDLHSLRIAIGERGFSGDFSDIQGANNLTVPAMKWLYFLTRPEGSAIPEELQQQSDTALRTAFYAVSDLSAEEMERLTKERAATATAEALLDGAKEKGKLGAWLAVLDDGDWTEEKFVQKAGITSEEARRRVRDAPAKE